MSTRTILIVMADGEMRQLLVDFCAILAIATVTAERLTQVPAMLHQHRVSEVITDSLQGHWPALVRLVRQQAGRLPITIWAVDGPARHHAEELGVRFVDQDSFALPALVNLQAEWET